MGGHYSAFTGSQISTSSSLASSTTGWEELRWGIEWAGMGPAAGVLRKGPLAVKCTEEGETAFCLKGLKEGCLEE